MVCTVPQGFGNSEDINVFIENEFYDYFQVCFPFFFSSPVVFLSKE